MKVIEVLSRKELSSANRNDAWRSRGYDLYAIARSWLSAFTSMKIAKAVAAENAEAVLVHTLDDAMAAISARKLCKENLKVVVVVSPNSKVPRSIPDDIVAGVDRWLFSSPRLQQAYPSTLKNKEVVIFYDYDVAIPENAERKVEKGRRLWVGPIDGNVDRLLAAINEVDRAEPPASLVICGTGKASNAMRAVRYSRTIGHPERIMWKGDDFNVVTEALRAESLVQADLDPCPIENTLLDKIFDKA